MGNQMATANSVNTGHATTHARYSKDESTARAGLQQVQAGP